MNIQEYLLNEEYQDLYCYKSLYRTIDILERGYIKASQKEAIDTNLDKYAVDEPHICVTRNKNYKNHNDERRINIGSHQELPGSFAAYFIIDANKIKNKYKIVPFRNPRFKDRDINTKFKNRYEAEERIIVDKLPLDFIKEIVISDTTNKEAIDKILKLARERKISAKVGKI